VIAGSTGGNMEARSSASDRRLGPVQRRHHRHLVRAVNSSLESFTGIGGAVPFANLSASEVIFGGVGTAVLDPALRAAGVFLGGLMVGRTPEYWARRSRPGRSSWWRWAS